MANIAMFKLIINCVSILLPALMSQGLKAASLAVFVPGLDSAARVSSVLKADPALSGLDVNVFSKYKDFALALKSKDFNYIVTSSFFLDYVKSYDAAFQLTNSGKSVYQFRIVALDGKWSKANLGNTTLAVVEALERDDTKDFLGKVLGQGPFKRIKNISKAEDIYPILAMGNADVAFVSQDMLDSMKASFATQPKEVARSSDVRFFVVAKKKNQTGAMPQFENLNSKSLAALGAGGITKYSSAVNRKDAKI